MGTKLKVVLCDEHGIGGSGEYFGDNDAHLDTINVFYHEASGGKYLPRAVLFNHEHRLCGVMRRVLPFRLIFLPFFKQCIDELYAELRLLCVEPELSPCVHF
jgi:tubulin beta